MSGSYFWSTKVKTFGGNDYIFAIIPNTFSGIKVSRSKAEIGIHAPSSISFQAVNPRSVYSAEYFQGADILLKLLIKVETTESIVKQWRFRVNTVESVYQTLFFEAEDYISQFLEGDWPNTPLVSSLTQTGDTPEQNDNLCVPVIFGEAFIPLRTAYVSADDKRYYILGSSGATYTVNEIQSPIDWGNSSSWLASEYTFNQYTKTIGGYSLSVLEPIIADSDGDGAADAMGLWYSNTLLDPQVRFSSSNTATLTNPANIIYNVLKDFGVPDSYIDYSGTFSSCASWYNTNSISFSMGFAHSRPRREILSELLNMSGAVLDIEEKIKLRIINNESQKTINDYYILGSHRRAGSFKYKTVSQKNVSDGLYVNVKQSGKPQSKMIKLLIPSATTSTVTNPSTDLLPMYGTHDTDVCQKMGRLIAQRKFNKSASISFNAKAMLLTLKPDQIITISGDNYGGTYKALIDSIDIERDLTLKFKCLRYSPDLEEFGDFTPGVVTISEDIGNFTWDLRRTGGYNSSNPSTIAGLVANPIARGVSFTWNKNYGEDVTHYGYAHSVSSSSGSPSSGWTPSMITLNNSVTRFLTEAEQTSYGQDARIAIKVIAVDVNQKTSATYATISGECLSATVGQIIPHEQGGLEKDVSAFFGLVKISSGLTTAVNISDIGQTLIGKSTIEDAKTYLEITDRYNIDNILCFDDGPIVSDGYVLETTSYENPIQAQIPTSGLIHHWVPNESGALFLEDIIGDNDGTIDSGYTAIDGPLGRALQGGETSGGSRTITLDSTITLSDNYTISLWVRRSDTGDHSISIGDKNTHGIRIQSQNLSYTSKIGWMDAEVSDLEANDIEWHHVIMEIEVDGGVDYAWFWLDGTKASTRVAITLVGITGFGYNTSSGDRSATDISGVRIYNRALTSDEIQALSNEKFINL